MQCRNCFVPLGWRYVHAERNDQKYKEGCTLLQQGLLRRVNCVKPTHRASLSALRRSSEIPAPPRRR